MARLFPLAILLVTGCSAGTVDRRGQPLAITTRVTWAITYSSSVGDGRLNPLTTESVMMLPVDEIQTVSR